MSLTNCKRCGTLIPSVGTRLCPDCLQAEDEEYHRLREYVRKHPEAPVMQVSKETGVPVARIYDLVRKGKLVAISPESDLAVECVGCGRRIVSGRLCQRCTYRLNSSHASSEDLRLRGRLHLKGRLQRD